jgi:lipid A 3-O-deacylase
MMTMLKRCAVLLLAVLIAGLSAGAQAKDRAVLSVGAGLHDLAFHRRQAAELRFEYRSGWGFLGTEDGIWRGFKPILGLMATTNSAAFGYAGLATPLSFADGDWEFVPSAGVGGYHQGNGLDLGGTFEFHLGLALNYELNRFNRIGVAVNHISNAHINGRNPGVNSVLLNWSFVFR